MTEKQKGRGTGVGGWGALWSHHYSLASPIDGKINRKVCFNELAD